jgi:Cd2+/Zn2+-exporting ATPase
VPGVSQVQVLFATEKLLVNADADIRAAVESAVRAAGYTLRDESAPPRKPRLCARTCR